ncbi:NAD(P)/FAD-dependent oxidoreductase [Foetidibacter luteolus]|uniref:NAD(P)/FAD-dependent oxidoreductase n=1 Tax=Foetidibacter luteolus TaxID=2608880 RepID=UPI00129A7632|nr:FAD-binding oxidoreductase [Foetidibacter luteolus]
MNLQSGYPYWLISAGLPYSYPKLQKDYRKDVVVLGGGISGALIAHAFCEAGIDCAVIDGRSIGLGSTCASTSLLQYQIDEPLQQLAEKRGLKVAERAYAACAASIDSLQAIAKTIKYKELERKKTLFFASSKKDTAIINKEYELHKAAGFKVEKLESGDIKKLFGFDKPNALYSNHSAVTNAYTFTHALLQHNLKKGLEVFDRTKVVDITHHQRSVQLVTEERCTITCRYLVYATGYEVVNHIRKHVVDLQSTFAVISEQMEPAFKWHDDCLIWETKTPYLYMRSVGNRILVGGRDEEFSNPAKRDALIKRKSALLEQDVKKLFPGMPFKPEFRWAGTFGSTKDGLPYIGKYKPLSNSFFALGFGGNGITFSAIAAEIIAQQILGKKHPDIDLYSFDR